MYDSTVHLVKLSSRAVGTRDARVARTPPIFLAIELKMTPNFATFHDLNVLHPLTLGACYGPGDCGEHQQC